MKISLNWLRNYIDLSDDTEKIGDIMTSLGLEIEGIEQFESIKGGLQGIVVGEVITCEKHPNADKLSVTRVNIGEEELAAIVCGAPNVAAGQKVLVALVGTSLYDNDGHPWKIKKAKIRGEVSHGMICAEDELGLGESHDGIMVLPDDYIPGKPATEYFEVAEDSVFDIGLTPNRSDATSHLGVARDLTAYYKLRNQNFSDVNEPDVTSFEIDNNDRPFSIEVPDREKCPRYSGITISGIEIKPSPLWMQHYLSAVGVRPINNIVDITNFVLHEYGQPLHAFDADKIKGDKIIVQCLPDQTIFTTLDEKERKLSGEDLMICDGEGKGMCIGGVFGGMDTGVTDETKTIFLESAHFNATSIRKTSTRHLLRTDAAMVFEKGSDPSVVVTALKRASQLIKEYANGTISSEIIDVYPEPVKPAEIRLTFRNLTRVGGLSLSKEEIIRVLKAMNMTIKGHDELGIDVLVTTDKSDVTREADLLEEFLRVYGYNNVPLPEKFHMTSAHWAFPDPYQVKEQLATLLTGSGFSEVMGLSIIDQKMIDTDIHPEQSHVKIMNTSNINLTTMRPDMVYTALETMAYNHNRSTTDLKFFEFGSAYKQGKDTFEETSYLTLFTSGNKEQGNWRMPSAGDSDYFYLKSHLMRLLQRTGIKNTQSQSLNDNAIFSFGQQVNSVDLEIAEFGAVKKSLLERYNISIPVMYGYINWNNLLKACNTKLISEDPPRFPGTRRDLALVIDNNVTYADIERIIKNSGTKLLKEIDLFDTYRDDDKIGLGKKSYAVSMFFQAESSTLKDKDVDPLISKMIKKLNKELGAVVRG